MRTREEIEKDLKRGLENTTHWQIGLEMMSAIQIEVLLDIRDLLDKLRTI